MNQDVQREWIEELTSGENLQGQHRLTTVMEDDAVRHCCLGVLCKIAVRHGIIPEPVFNWASDPIDRLNGIRGRLVYGDESTYLPDAVVEWAELKRISPEVTANGHTGHEEPVELAWLNDNGYDFGTIAELIRQL